MLFPMFYGFIAPDAAIAHPLNAVKVAVNLAGKLDAQLSVAIGARQLSVPSRSASASIRR